MRDLAEVAGDGDVRQVVAGAARPDRRWGLIALAVVAVCALPAVLLGTRIDGWTGRELASTPGAAGVAGLVVALLALDTVLPVPSSVLATLAGQRLGFVNAAVAIFVGLCLGNGLGYLIGRLGGSRAVDRLLGADQRAWARGWLCSRPGATALTVTRPVPILGEAAVVLAGAARAPVGRTAAVCGLANLGLAVVYAGLGDAAHGPFALPLALAGSVGVPVLALAGSFVLDRDRRRRPVPQPATD